MLSFFFSFVVMLKIKEEEASKQATEIVQENIQAKFAEILQRFDWSKMYADEVQQLEAMHQKQTRLNELIGEADQQLKELQKSIEFARTLVANSNEVENNAEKANLQEPIDCFICGLPFSLNTFSKHSEICFNKRLGLPAKSNVDATLLCGYPSNESSKGYCDKLKKNCVRHLNWEVIKRAKLEQRKMQTVKKKNDLALKIRIFFFVSFWFFSIDCRMH